MMRSGSWWCLVCLFSWVGVAHATPAEDEAARRHFESGRAYFERAEYDDAVREYEKAYALSSRPPLLVNISRAHESAGRPAEAADALDRWLAVAAPDDPMREEIESRNKRLRAQAEKLAQAAEQAPPQSGAIEEAPAAQAPRTSDEPHQSKVGPWLLMGMGGAALAGGAVVVILGRSDISAVEDAKAGTRWSSVKDQVDSGPRKVMIGSVLGGVGAAALLSGVIWYVMGNKDFGDANTQVGVSAEGVRVWGRF